MDRGSWNSTGGSGQDHPQEKEMHKGKMVVWVGPDHLVLLMRKVEKKIDEKRRETKGKGEKERNTHFNAEF